MYMSPITKGICHKMVIRNKRYLFCTFISDSKLYKKLMININIFTN